MAQEHSDPVVMALLKALAQAPHADLHLTVGDRLLSLGEGAAALPHFQAVLATDPVHLGALGGAHKAALSAGETATAEGYGRLLAALGGAAVPPAQAAPTGPAVVPSIAPSPAASTPLRPVPQPTTAGAGLDPGPVPPSNVLSLLPTPGAEAERTTFADVGGLENVKKRVELSFLAPMRDPALFRAYGKTIKGGLLLYGPPGCGKTHIARATAGEVGARFVSIGIIDVLDMWLGESEKRLHELFVNVRRQAPAVLFLDEIDALGQKRSQMRNSAGRNLVNQLLVELDGLEQSDGVYVLAATNHPWDVDAALKRPGRFDRTVLVPPPDPTARAVIMERHMQGRPQEGLDFATLAGRCNGYSGADLVHLCDSAIEMVLEEALQGGAMRPVRMGDFVKALKEVQPSIGAWVDVARNYALYANEGGAYDELAQWLKGHR